MASGDDNKQQIDAWPIPKFRFEVDFGTGLNGVAFQEISGLDVESQVIEYRKNNSPLFSTQKMPGIKKYGNITMKRGVFVNDNAFWDWHKKVSMNNAAKQTVLIKLLDESGAVSMQWRLDNAWPTKITNTDLKTDGNYVAFDTIEIAHEQITITNG